MNISDDRAEAALRYLVSTDESCATLEADSERAEFKAKAIRDSVFLISAGTVAERTALAGASPEYTEAMSAYFDLLGQYKHVRNKRETETIVIDCWRSIQANQRKGNI